MDEERKLSEEEQKKLVELSQRSERVSEVSEERGKTWPAYDTNPGEVLLGEIVKIETRMVRKEERRFENKFANIRGVRVKEGEDVREVVKTQPPKLWTVWRTDMLERLFKQPVGTSAAITYNGSVVGQSGWVYKNFDVKYAPPDKKRRGEVK